MTRARVVLVLAVLVVLAASSPAYASSTTGRLLVTLDAPSGIRAAAARIVATGTDVSGPVVPELALVTVSPPAGVSTGVAAGLLRGLPGVRSVAVEHRYTPRYTPNDPALSTPDPFAPEIPVEWWALKQNLPAAWDITRGGGAKVAVIDTGIDAAHPDFAGQISGSTDHDDDPGTGAATVDETGHGTHVASLACGKPNNGVGMVGAGLNCTLLIFKSDFTEASVAESIVDAVKQGADSINMSFGTDGNVPASGAVTAAIDYAYDHGVIMAAAAADDPVQEQGDPSNVLQPTGSGADITQGKGLSVTSASFTDGRSYFAGYGSQISIAAYGSYMQQGGPPGIFGAFPGNVTRLEQARLGSPACQCRTTFAGDNRYAYLQGTSMASPMVAAVAALVRNLNPDLGAGAIIRLMKQTARRPVNSGWTPDLGWGILDGGAALAAARVADARAPKSRISSSKKLTRTRLKLSFTSSDSAPSHCVASGVKKLELWRSSAGHKPKLVNTTTKQKLTVSVTPGTRYSYYTVAVDKAGNKEKAPSKPDVRLTGKA